MNYNGDIICPAKQLSYPMSQAIILSKAQHKNTNGNSFYKPFELIMCYLMIKTTYIRPLWLHDMGS